jgi:hypothetical protein
MKPIGCDEITAAGAVHTDRVVDTRRNDAFRQSQGSLDESPPTHDHTITDSRVLAGPVNYFAHAFGDCLILYVDAGQSREGRRSLSLSLPKTPSGLA